MNGETVMSPAVCEAILDYLRDKGVLVGLVNTGFAYRESEPGILTDAQVTELAAMMPHLTWYLRSENRLCVVCGDPATMPSLQGIVGRIPGEYTWEGKPKIDYTPLDSHEDIRSRKPPLFCKACWQGDGWKHGLIDDKGNEYIAASSRCREQRPEPPTRAGVPVSSGRQRVLDFLAEHDLHEDSDHIGTSDNSQDHHQVSTGPGRAPAPVRGN